MTPSQRRQANGFTLIEMMIVLVIIGILTSLALPKLSFFQNQAKVTSVKAFAHNLQLSVEAYYLLSGSYPSSTNADLDDLLTELQSQNILNTIPTNPFTGAAFAANDPSGKLTYAYVSSSGIYTITGFGAANSQSVITLHN